MGLFGSGKKQDKNESGGEATLGDGSVIKIATKVDCLGDSCPRPQLMTKKALGSSSKGDVIEVTVDNPTSMEALPPMCPQLSSTYLETVSFDNGWRVYIQKN